ncbi:MAG: zinc/iron-chelating domain-containing protein [Bacteroidetes bacterium]|nr:MAG: zinc/iron-chelating domain-containing protein [Bacteroidota bacterium]PTM10792.1 MAG: zinc/iron-chelating domain-containing protein [Bacteroidota bacterium]
MEEKKLADLLPNIKALAREDKKNNQRFFARLRRRPPRDLDATVADLHAATFAEMDCLQCANCCKTTSPIFRDVDIDRLAQHRGQRPADFVAEFLHLDADGDYVLHSAPCPFLGADNYCSVYAARPRACREYPHTDRKNFHQILDLTLRNTAICPAAYRIVQRLRAVF